MEKGFYQRDVAVDDNNVLDLKDGEGESNDNDNYRGMALSLGLEAMLTMGKSPTNAVDANATGSEG